MKSIQSIVRAFLGFCLLTAIFPAMADSSYQINPGDFLRVDIWNEESLTRDVLVRPDGYISFPLAGEIKVGGQTNTAGEQALAEGLGKFLKDTPAVTISVLDPRGYKIYVLGKVNRPGEYPINRPTDVMQALAMAGGLNAFAAENNISVLRRDESGEQSAIRFKYGQVKGGDKLQSNILLQSGDVVVVP